MKALEQRATMRPSDHDVTAYLVQDSPAGILALGDKARQQYPRLGKWLVFTWSMSFADMIWGRIAAATREGRLGVFAKASTAKPDPKHADRFQSGLRLIQVYTADHDDQADVERVREALFAMGVKSRIHYKRQSDSDKGVYSSPGKPVATMSA